MSFAAGWNDPLLAYSIDALTKSICALIRLAPSWTLE
jgi:hypothetical protein